MWPTLLIIVYCVLIMAASLLGGWLPSVVRFTHTRMQITMSFVAGLMMGVALLHMLPHAAVEAGSLDHVACASVLGLLAMFFVIRIFHVHGHEPPDSPVEEHGHECQHPPGRCHEHPHVHELSWLGLFGGLAMHTLIDGVALAASVAAQTDGDAMGLIGLGTFVAVVLHKPLDALSITSIMLAGGWSPKARRIINIAFSLMCPIGAVVFYFAVGTLGEAARPAVGWSLGFAAGAFLCISLADVLPEVQFHRHDRLKLSTALILGVALAWAIGLFEPSHEHSPETPAAQHSEHHDH
jgi:zinc and cadmium transporter